MPPVLEEVRWGQCLEDDTSDHRQARPQQDKGPTVQQEATSTHLGS